MDKERKVALSILGVFSLLVIIIFFINLRNDIKKPFVIPIIESSGEQESSCADGNCSGGDNLSSDNLDLKLVDTDGDTISDWDELFIHGTSPYLEDTDGDNLTDYEELFVYKTDPLCPQGQNCSSSVSSENQTTSNELVPNIDNSLSGQVLDPESISQFYDISPSELRKQLIEAGFSQEEIDLISDEELLNIYQQSLYQTMQSSQQ
ncbi:MAG: hypothetical protein WCY43_00255 [Patescibacteria group bacterium]|jgi:hypothetical protein|nr:hypothetical protein [Patescibacteria group bacterium]